MREESGDAVFQVVSEILFSVLFSTIVNFHMDSMAQELSCFVV